MESGRSGSESERLAEMLEAEFSFVGGGPMYRLQQRLGLIKPGSPYLARRAALAVLLTWFPLLVLSLLQGLAIGQEVRIPFLHDLAAYARFLVALPLLILAEEPIGHHMVKSATQFLRSGLVSERNYPDYESALARAGRLRDSILVEVVLIGIACVSVVVVYREFPFNFSTWRSFVSDSVHTRTLAGWWHLCVGVPLFQFLFWRWLWRLFIWYGFLWRLSKLDLQLIPTHPDRAAGLGFVGETQRSFGIIVFAFSVAAAGVVGNETVFAGVPFKSYEFPLAGYVVVVLLVFLGPLLIFMPRLIGAKVKSLHDYSALAVTHNRMFDGKWVQGDNPRDEPVLGTPDITSLANLGCAFEAVKRMRFFPFDPLDALFLALLALIPMAPLLLTVLPLGEMIKLVSKVLF